MPFLKQILLSVLRKLRLSCRLIPAKDSYFSFIKTICKWYLEIKYKSTKSSRYTLWPDFIDGCLFTVDGIFTEDKTLTEEPIYLNNVLKYPISRITCGYSNLAIVRGHEWNPNLFNNFTHYMIVISFKGCVDFH